MFDLSREITSSITKDALTLFDQGIITNKDLLKACLKITHPWYKTVMAKKGLYIDELLYDDDKDVKMAAYLYKKEKQCSN